MKRKKNQCNSKPTNKQKHKKTTITSEWENDEERAHPSEAITGSLMISCEIGQMNSYGTHGTTLSCAPEVTTKKCYCKQSNFKLTVLLSRETEERLFESLTLFFQLESRTHWKSKLTDVFITQMNESSPNQPFQTRKTEILFFQPFPHFISTPPRSKSITTCSNRRCDMNTTVNTNITNGMKQPFPLIGVSFQVLEGFDLK